MNTKRNVVPEDVILTSVRLPRELHAQFAEVARSHHRSLSGELRAVMESHIAASAQTGEPKIAA